MGVTWLTAFLDTPERYASAAEAYWASVSGWPLSTRRGEQDEFVTFQPRDGDAVLKGQVVAEPPPGLMHLDVHTDDVEALCAQAQESGATRLADGDGYVVHRSPEGVTFCVVPHGGGRRPAPVPWPAGRSLVDQVSVDVPAAGFDREARFWSDLLGRPRAAAGAFARLLPPEGQPLQVLMQRLDEPDGPARLHLDLSADDVAAEVGRHLDLGAQCARLERHWTTLMDPAGRLYCVTGRDPSTGRLP